MHLALKAYQELLLNLNEMDHSQDENIRQSANVIKSKMLPALVPELVHQWCMFRRVYDSWFETHLLGNIFYMMEYREIFLTLLRKYDETKQPQSYLQDLVESTHLFLRMLERFCSGRKNVIVQVGYHVKFLKRRIFFILYFLHVS